MLSSGVFAERILLALVLGIAIGVERQWRQRMAGLRTNALVAVGAALYGMKDSISFFYPPSQAAAAHVPAGRGIQLGGLVRTGSVVKKPDGEVDFVVADKRATSAVRYRGELPDLFREGQGVVAMGAMTDRGTFNASEILAKHDEKYMPPEVVDALKRSGHWKEGQQ